jgi:hypothetical protein
MKPEISCATVRVTGGEICIKHLAQAGSVVKQPHLRAIVDDTNPSTAKRLGQRKKIVEIVIDPRLRSSSLTLAMSVAVGSPRFRLKPRSVADFRLSVA